MSCDMNVLQCSPRSRSRSHVHTSAVDHSHTNTQTQTQTNNDTHTHTHTYASLYFSRVGVRSVMPYYNKMIDSDD